jgi:hypothetical protein
MRSPIILQKIRIAGYEPICVVDFRRKGQIVTTFDPNYYICKLRRTKEGEIDFFFSRKRGRTTTLRSPTWIPKVPETFKGEIPKIQVKCPKCGEESEFPLQNVGFIFINCKHHFKINIENLKEILQILLDKNLVEVEAVE